VVSRPVIGITAAIEPARYGPWEEPAAFAPAVYSDAVRIADGLALLIPPDDANVEAPDEVLDLLDGLILSGGSDIDPGTYGATPHPETRGTVPGRDRSEVALARRALDRDMPLLGICRGMQLLNVALGGTLHQHLPDLVGTEEHRRTTGTWPGNEHDVELDAGSGAARLAGETVHRTFSHHHQAIDALGEGLVVTGRAPFDDLPEAIERPDRSLVVGVQWHPEVDPASAVVGTFVREAAALRERRAAA
jgi:putative glutamine amidotransferase